MNFFSEGSSFLTRSSIFNDWVWSWYCWIIFGTIFFGYASFGYCSMIYGTIFFFEGNSALSWLSNTSFLIVSPLTFSSILRSDFLSLNLDSWLLAIVSSFFKLKNSSLSYFFIPMTLTLWSVTCTLLLDSSLLTILEGNLKKVFSSRFWSSILPTCVVSGFNIEFYITNLNNLIRFQSKLIYSNDK